MLNLGLNSGTINYEVALEILGQGRQPYMKAIADERRKSKPSQVMIDYCETQLAALDDLQDNLMPSDSEVITRILQQDDPVFRRA
jgi:hypothetical protein